MTMTTITVDNDDRVVGLVPVDWTSDYTAFLNTRGADTPPFRVGLGDADLLFLAYTALRMVRNATTGTSQSTALRMGRLSTVIDALYPLLEGDPEERYTNDDEEE